MRRVVTIIALQMYALCLACVQYGIGLRTDEAKYLLNIPYPHPPVMRWLLHVTEWMPLHELFWRVVFATLLVQAIWIVWDMGRSLSFPKRNALSVLWLLSAGMVLQAGAIMMAPITAFQGLCLLWFISRGTEQKHHTALYALFWLATLFTAYQGILFAPIAAILFWKLRRSTGEFVLYFFVPIVLLGVYTFAHPLSLASMVIHGERDLSTSLFGRIFATGRLLGIGGSIVLSVLGVLGMVRSLRWDIILSFLLVCAYIALSRYDYYMVLFPPLLIVGLISCPSFLRYHKSTVCITGIVCILLAYSYFVSSWGTSGLARDVFERTKPMHGVAIAGSFGHQWQYESSVPVYRLTEKSIELSDMVICLDECDVSVLLNWDLVQSDPDVWTRSF